MSACLLHPQLRTYHCDAANRRFGPRTTVLHCGKTASLFAISNSGYPLCRWQAIAKSRQLLEQRLGFFQVERIEAFGEPAIDRSEKIAAFLPLALIAPEPREACGGSEFSRAGLLLTCYQHRILQRILGC